MCFSPSTVGSHFHSLLPSGSCSKAFLLGTWAKESYLNGLLGPQLLERHLPSASALSFGTILRKWCCLPVDLEPQPSPSKRYRAEPSNPPEDKVAKEKSGQLSVSESVCMCLFPCALLPPNKCFTCFTTSHFSWKFIYS